MSGIKAWSVLRDDDGDLHTQCPHCQALGSINEKDIAIRWNRLSLSEDGTTAVAHTGQGDFDGDGWICDQCLTTDLVAPDGFEVTDWI